MKSKLILRLSAAALAFALIGAACGGTDNTVGDATAGTSPSSAESSEDTSDAAASADGAIDTPAAQTAQVLVSQLDSHEYLAGYAVAMGVQNGLDSPQFTAAAEALDTNSVDLSKTVGSVYGDEAAGQFLDLWRKHIGFFVDYTKGTATGDNKLAKKAEKNLDGYRSDFGAFIEGATNGELPKEAIEKELKTHVGTTLDAIDAVIGKSDENPFVLLKEAAYHLRHVGVTLAGGIATSQGIEGSADSGPSELQALLTSQLSSHEYLAGAAVAMGVMKGLDSPEFTAAAEALDTNSVDLSESIGSVYGDAAADQFLDLWRKHIGFFVDYTKGQATGDKKLVKQARKDLDGYRADFGALIESATEGGLPKDAVADALKMHVDMTFDAIDAVTGKSDGNPFLLLKEAAYHLPSVATVLAGAIVDQFPDKF